MGVQLQILTPVHETRSGTVIPECYPVTRSGVTPGPSGSTLPGPSVVQITTVPVVE